MSKYSHSLIRYKTLLLELQIRLIFSPYHITAAATPVLLIIIMADLSVKKGELPLSALSAYSTIPTSRNGPKQFNYFQNIAKVSFSAFALLLLS